MKAATAADSLDAANRPCVYTHSSMLAAGSVNQLDTYLSPLEYKGSLWSFVQQNMRPAHLGRLRFVLQNNLSVDLSNASSPTDDGTYLGGMLDWHVGALMPVATVGPVAIEAGPRAGVDLGFLYSTRNGNNPAQARLSADIGISARATWAFALWHKSMRLSYQGDLPLLALMFSPHYGQSYYEIFSLDHTDHNLCCTSMFAAVSYMHLLALDIPLGRTDVRIGYRGVVRQSQVNNLKAHDWGHQLVVGFVRHFRL